MDIIKRVYFEDKIYYTVDSRTKWGQRVTVLDDPTLILGIGSTVELSEDKKFIINVINKVESLPPLNCEKCGNECKSTEEVLDHVRNCEFRGYP